MTLPKTRSITIPPPSAASAIIHQKSFISPPRAGQVTLPKTRSITIPPPSAASAIIHQKFFISPPRAGQVTLPKTRGFIFPPVGACVSGKFGFGFFNSVTDFAPAADGGFEFIGECQIGR